MSAGEYFRTTQPSRSHPDVEELTAEFERSVAAIDQQEYQELFGAFLQARGITPPHLSAPTVAPPLHRLTADSWTPSWELAGTLGTAALAIGGLIVLVLTLMALISLVVANWLPLTVLTVVGCASVAGVLHVRATS